MLRAKIMGPDAKPVTDAYIINYRNVMSNVSSPTGQFNIWVQHGDSLIISHISYNSKRIFADSIINNSVIFLIPSTRNILEVNVSPNFKSDYERARDNINSLAEIKLIPFSKIKEEPNPVLDMATENNRVLRTEAASVSLLRISLSQQITNTKKKIQRNKDSKHYSSTKEVK